MSSSTHIIICISLQCESAVKLVVWVTQPGLAWLSQLHRHRTDIHCVAQATGAGLSAAGLIARPQGCLDNSTTGSELGQHLSVGCSWLSNACPRSICREPSLRAVVPTGSGVRYSVNLSRNLQ